MMFFKLLVLACVCGLPLSLAAQDMRGLGATTSRFSWDNDFYFFRDAQISNVFSYQQHQAAEAIVDDDHRAWHRQSWAIQQTMQTPQKSTAIAQQGQDVPFVGVLSYQKSWYTFDAQQLDGFAITLGVSGPLSLADKTQEAVHSVRGVTIYEGWSKQYPTEPIVNVHMMKKRKIGGDVQGRFWDIAVGGHAALGNLMSQLGGEIELRLGGHLPIGFAYVPNSFGFNSHYLASISVSKAMPTWYASLVLQTDVVFHNLYLDGSLLQDSPRTFKKEFVSLMIVGIHYEMLDYGIHFSWLLSSQNVDHKLAPKAIANERLGALTYDWRY